MQQQCYIIIKIHYWIITNVLTSKQNFKKLNLVNVFGQFNYFTYCWNHNLYSECGNLNCTVNSNCDGQTNQVD